MVKKIFIGLMTAVVILGISSLSFAMSCHGGSAKEEGVRKHSSYGVKAEAVEETVQKAEQKAVNVGNKICPVSGEKIGSGGMKAETFEYKGKIYNFCCPMCIEEFKKDPEKYIKKVEEELKQEKKALQEEKDQKLKKSFEAEQEREETNLPEEMQEVR